MDGLDDDTLSTLNAANIDEALLHILSHDDLRDLFPGPENFLRRKQLWGFISQEDENSSLPDKAGPGETGIVSPLRGTPPVSPQTSTPLVKRNPQKTPQLPSPPEYVIYTDSELELARKHYFEMACIGREEESTMSKELRCRQVRNTITSMISILRASQQGEELRYPSKHEVTAMAKRLVEYFPMLQDKDGPLKYMSMYSQKRMLNVKSPQKRQGPTPQRGGPNKRRHVDFSSSNKEEERDTDSSGGSTILLPPESSSDRDSSSEMDSLATQVRHYKTLQEMYRKPNQDAVCQILDLEFQARRAFIDSNLLKEEDRATKILEAYPCFKELHHVMDELHRILDMGNKFIAEVKTRCEEFYSKVQFYGVWKKMLKPPMNLSGVEYYIAPPKKTGTCQ